MKTFILSIPESLRQMNAKIDAKAALCKKAWIVFNDEGVKQIFYFKKNGELKISTNGDVTKFTWEYEPSDNSIIVFGTNNSGALFHPIFCNDLVFALQKDSTEQYLCLIDTAFSSRVNTVAALNEYLEKEGDRYVEPPEEDNSGWLLSLGILLICVAIMIIISTSLL